MTNHDYKSGLVTVIVPTHNRAKLLKRSINSIIQQDYANIEIIIIQDNCNDNTYKIVNQFSDSRIKSIISNNSLGGAGARNLGIQNTNGEYIAFLDTDDWWVPTKLEKQIPLFSDHEVGLVYGNVWLFFDKQNKKKIYKKTKLPTGKILNELLNDYVIGSPTYVIRKKSLEKLEYFFNDNFHIIGDFDINIRLAAKFKIDCIQSPVAYYRKHNTNLSLLNKKKEIDEIKIWFKQMQNNQFISSQSNFRKVLLMAHYLEATRSIMENGFIKSMLIIEKYPFCFNKLKLVLALLLPKFLLRIIKDY